MQIVNRKISELIPYVNNARKNDHAVDAVASSIKNYGFKQPIVIDSQGEVIAGHTRLKASIKLGLDEVPCIIADDLTPAQVKAYRIADNKVSELSEWDYELLKLELEDIEGFTGFEVDELEDLFENESKNNNEDNPYTTKIEVPIYQITGEKPTINDLVNKEKTFELINKIKNSKVENEIKDFLILSAYRHLTFDYSKIAEFYAHSNIDTQQLMEELALIIIDFEKAIENGFISFNVDNYDRYVDSDGELYE